MDEAMTTNGRTVAAGDGRASHHFQRTYAIYVLRWPKCYKIIAAIFAFAAGDYYITGDHLLYQLIHLFHQLAPLINFWP